LTSDEQETFGECSADDFQVAIAILEAAMAGEVEAFSASGKWRFYGQAFNVFNSLRPDRQRFWNQQDDARFALLNVGVRLTGLRGEAGRRWPGHPQHGHWWTRPAIPDH
jgi:hypothetical protein